MAKAILEPGSHLQWLSWWREEMKAIAPQNKVRGSNISKDQLLGEGHSARFRLNMMKKP